MNESASRPSTATTLLAVYIASRIALYAMGVRFDASGIEGAWQLLGVATLKHHLLQGLLYQHSQPPLFNLFVGLFLKVFTIHNYYAFMAVYYLLSLAIYFLIYKIFIIFEFRHITAFIAATLFILAPEAILFENWLLYTWPVSAILTIAFYNFLLYERHRHFKHAAIFLLAISAICLIRSMFHLVYLMLCIALILAIPSDCRKKLVVCAVLSILMVGSIYLKN